VGLTAPKEVSTVSVRQALQKPWAPCSRSIFRCLSEAQLTRLRSAQVWHTYAPGRPICYEGTPALAVFHIRDGMAKLWRAGHAGDEHTVGWLRPGEVIGLRAAILGGPYSTTAEPMTCVTAGTIPRDAFVDLVRDNPQFALCVLEQLARRTIEVEEWIMSRVLDSVIKRTARMLLLHDGPGNPEHTHDGPTLPRKREDLARLIGTSPETLCRTLRILHERSVIELRNHDIHVKDWEALRRLVE